MAIDVSQNKEISIDLKIISQGWPSFLCKAPTLLPTRVGCAINVGQGWPIFQSMRQNFSPHKHSLQDAPHKHSFLFIAYKRVVVYLHLEVKRTPY